MNAATSRTRVMSERGAPADRRTSAKRRGAGCGGTRLGVTLLAAAMLLAGPVSAQRRGGPEREADAFTAVAARIVEAMKARPELADERILVYVTGLLITLRGEVDSDAERELAVDIAREHRTQQQIVADDLRVSTRIDPVTPPLAMVEQLEASVERLVERRVAVVTDAGVEVTTSTLVTVVLSGTVTSEEERQVALNAARNTPGVGRVVDRLTLVVTPGRRPGREVPAAPGP